MSDRALTALLIVAGLAGLVLAFTVSKGFAVLTLLAIAAEYRHNTIVARRRDR